jgi:SpoVK/Ycf46/Vps4 family AAA+-type ATPase
LCELFTEEKVNAYLFKTKAEKIILDNLHIDFFKNINHLKLEHNYQMMYFLLIWETLTGSQTSDIEQIIDKIISSPRLKIKLVQEFNNKAINKLIILDFIEIEEDDFINNSKMKLSEKSLNILKKEGLQLFNNSKAKKEKNTILYTEIAKVKMYYNASEEKEISMLHNSLKESNYKKLQARLNKKNLPTGITSLFYGYPGTGKTESVLQIAKQTGRDIMKVDISQTKSKWFGDSEKLIKQIFTNYYNFKKTSKKTPILLFNEADAVISKRKDSGSSAVAQTENAIQNIILEELETFDGIFIATTNLASNLDTAFERRFLFKVEFNKPTVEVKAKIWKTKLINLTPIECKLLAKEFNFTGGQINNILKKCEMIEVLESNKLTFENIRTFCKEENIVKQVNNKIGF